MENGNAMLVLQEQLALHAPDLIEHNLMDLKTVITTMQSLEASRRPGEGTGGTEQALQRFLRGEDPELKAEGMVQ